MLCKTKFHTKLTFTRVPFGEVTQRENKNVQKSEIRFRSTFTLPPEEFSNTDFQLLEQETRVSLHVPVGIHSIQPAVYLYSPNFWSVLHLAVSHLGPLKWPHIKVIWNSKGSVQCIVSNTIHFPLHFISQTLLIHRKNPLLRSILRSCSWGSDGNLVYFYLFFTSQNNTEHTLN
jgi:hypothetical protein